MVQPGFSSARRKRPALGLQQIAFTAQSADGVETFSIWTLPAVADVAGAVEHRQSRSRRNLDPAESVRHLVTLPGFEVSLFAADPEITKPIWLAWDDRGRLWIAETIDYPNDMQPPGQGRDRIKICEDTNQDGRADKFTIFADGLACRPASSSPMAA
jgi:hypothetical protein